MPASAAIVIIGNEILSGKVKDENFHFLAKELRGLGVALRFAALVPDDVEEIARVIKEYSDKCDFVFTSGGVGPTHDDVTMKGIARAFGLRTVPNERMRENIIKHCGYKPSEVVLRMAELPEGALLIDTDGMNFPPVLVKNVYIFPGIPEFLRKKFNAIKERFRGEKPYHLKLFYLNEEECCIAEALETVAGEFGGVEIGSYPKIGEKDFKVMVTLESRDEEALSGAAGKLLALLPPHVVVRVG